MDTYPTTALPADVLVLLLEKRLLADGLVATAGFLSCALISSEWHCATVEVAARHRLLRRDLVIGRKPTDAMHAGSLDGPKAVCPMAGGGVVVADTRNGRCRRVSCSGEILDDGNEMGVQLPDCVALQPLDNGGSMIWATNRGSGPMALAHGPLGKIGRLGRGISLPQSDGSRRRVEGLAYSRELGVRLLLFHDHVEASAVDARGQEVFVVQEEERAGDGQWDRPGEASYSESTYSSREYGGYGGEEGEPSRSLAADGLTVAFGYGELSGHALCITTHGSEVYVGDGGRHAVLVFACTFGCRRARFVRQLGSTGVGSPSFREPIGVAVGRSNASANAVGAATADAAAAGTTGAGDGALVHVADWDRLFVLSRAGQPLQVIPIAGCSTRRLNGLCIDADNETVWVVSAEQSALLRLVPHPLARAAGAARPRAARGLEDAVGALSLTLS